MSRLLSSCMSSLLQNPLIKEKSMQSISMLCLNASIILTIRLKDLKDVEKIHVLVYRPWSEWHQACCRRDSPGILSLQPLVWQQFLDGAYPTLSPKFPLKKKLNIKAPKIFNFPWLYYPKHNQNTCKWQQHTMKQ